jgi:hypothetical protein
MDHAHLARRLSSSAFLVVSAITLCTFSVRAVQAQQSAVSTTVEVQFREPASADNHVYYADRETGTLLPLERQAQKVYSSKRARCTIGLYLGFCTGSAGTVVSDARSSFRIKSVQRQEFVSRFSPNLGIDRSSAPAVSHYVVLIPLTSKKNRREFEMASWHQDGLFGEFEYDIKPPVQERVITVHVEPYGDGSALIAPVTPLPPGEYAFWANGENCSCKNPKNRCESFFYTFGVDPPDTEVSRTLGSEIPMAARQAGR